MITCLFCGLTSFNPADVAEKFCGTCGVFHDDVEPTQRLLEQQRTGADDDGL